MRLIDADALFKDICDSINEMTKIGLCVDGEWLWAKLNDALENAPTIELRKGRWIVKRDIKTGVAYGECSSCGMKNYAGHTNFCPDCGAKLKEGADG